MDPLIRRARRAAAALLVSASLPLLAAASKPPAAPLAPPVDEGLFDISVAGHRIGTEDFAFRVLADSLCLVSQVRMVIDDPSGRRDTVQKQVFMAVGKDDYLLHQFQSNERYRGRELVRGVVVTPNDTVFSVFREYEGHGAGDRRILPPGRMYVMDSRLFSLIDFITLSVHTQGFDRRPITLFTLGPEDTLVEATLARTGRDTLNVAGRATPVGRMKLSQGNLAFDMWVDAKGRVLRLEHAPTGLVVERRSKPASGAAAKPKSAAAKPASKP